MFGIKKIAAVFAATMVGYCVAEDFVRYVDPLVGTVGEGNTFPGSCSPFGLVQASGNSSRLHTSRRSFGVWRHSTISAV